MSTYAAILVLSRASFKEVHLIIKILKCLFSNSLQKSFYPSFLSFRNLSHCNNILFYFFNFIFVFLILIFIVIQLHFYEFSPHPST